MNQSPGSRRSRREARFFTGRTIAGNGTTAETHVYDHVPELVDPSQVSSWIHQMPVSSPQFTYVDPSFIPSNYNADRYGGI